MSTCRKYSTITWYSDPIIGDFNLISRYMCLSNNARQSQDKIMRSSPEDHLVIDSKVPTESCAAEQEKNRVRSASVKSVNEISSETMLNSNIYSLSSSMHLDVFIIVIYESVKVNALTADRRK